jgi:hypothetical protein
VMHGVERRRGRFVPGLAFGLHGHRHFSVVMVP